MSERKLSERVREQVSESDYQELINLEEKISRLEKALLESERWRKAYEKGKKRMIQNGGESERLAKAHLPANDYLADFSVAKALIELKRIHPISIEVKKEKKRSVSIPIVKKIKRVKD